MWSSPQVGNAPLQQNNSIPNQQGNVQFTPGIVGLFHPGSGGFPPFPGGNYNPNPNPISFVGLPLRWNWNANTSLGPQNVGLAFFGSSLQQLGTNPSFGPVGGTHPLGKQSVGSQLGSTPQMNARFNPHSTQLLGGMTGPSKQLLGQVQSLSQFQQMGGSNAPFNPSTLSRKGLQQHQQPPHLGAFVPNLPFQQPYVEAGNVPPNTTPQGGSNFQPSWNQLGGTYASRGPQNFENVPFTGGFNPSQQGEFTTPYTNQPQIGGYTQFLGQKGQNPNRGHIKIQTNFILECLMVALGYT